MTDDTITQAMDLAKRLNRGSSSRSAVAKVSPAHVCPDARPVKLSPKVLERNRLIGGVSDQRVVDSYSLLRTRILHRVQQHKVSTLGITSPSSKDGKSLTAANLAISIALGESHPVLLVDADTRRPTQANLFGIRVDAGLGDYLAGHRSLEDTLLRTSIDGLYLLPGRGRSTVRPESLSTEKVRQLATMLKQQMPGGIVILDLPPALVGGDVAAFAPIVDALLLVVADRRTSEDAIAETLPLLEGAHVIGTVLNYSSEASSRYDYYGGR